MADSSTSVPVLRCIITAFVFLRRNLAYVYVTGAIYIITALLSFAFSVYAPDASMLAAFGALLGLALIPLKVMLYAAYLRRALGLPASGVLDLRLGADEGRLFLTMFAVFTITGFIVFLYALFGAFWVSAVVASIVDPAIVETEPASAFAQSGMAGQAALVLAASGLVALLLYTLARFAPAFAAAIAEKRVVVFEAAALSKGQGWRMVLAMVGASLPFYLILAPGTIQYFHLVLNATIQAQSGSASGPAAMALDLKPLSWYFALSALLWPAMAAINSSLYAVFYRGLLAARQAS